MGLGRHDEQIANMATKNSKHGYKKRASKVFGSFLLQEASAIKAQKHRLT